MCSSSLNRTLHQSDVEAVHQAFLNLGSEIDTVRHLEGGTNNSPEPLAEGFTHGYVVSFDDQAGLDAYGPHPAHQKLVELLRPVMQEVRVIDFMVKH